MTVNTFCCFLSTSVHLPSKSLFLLLNCSLSHTHSTLLTFTFFFNFKLTLSHSISFFLIHYFTCPFLSTSLCPPSVSFSLHYLSHSTSTHLSHLPVSVWNYSIACRDSAFVSNSLLHFTCTAICPSFYFPFSSYPVFCFSLSQNQSNSLISLHSFGEGHMYFHRWLAIVCLLHLSVKLLNSWRQQVLMKV